jgi:hypothetical protein
MTIGGDARQIQQAAWCQIALDETSLGAGPALHSNRSFPSFDSVDRVPTELRIQAAERPSRGVENPHTTPAIDENQKILNLAVTGGRDVQDVFNLPQYAVHKEHIGGLGIFFG